MKKIYKTNKGDRSEIPQHGYFRRFMRQLYSSWIKRHNYERIDEQMDMVMEMVKDVEFAIDDLSHAVAELGKRHICKTPASKGHCSHR